MSNPDHAPIHSDGYGQYFAQALEVELPTRGLVVRVYHTPLRGGGVMIMHHGAGYSAMSFACVAKELHGITGKDVGVLAFDARRHGKCSLLSCSVCTSCLIFAHNRKDCFNGRPIG